MVNVRQKPPDRLANPRGGRGRGLVVVARDYQAPIPKPPRGIGTHARRIWREFWASPVASAVNWQADQEQLRNWILSVDERERLRELLASNPLVKSTNGTLMLNPLARRVRQLTDDITRTAEQFGMTPMSRFRLQLTYSEARVSDMRAQDREERRASDFEAERRRMVLDAD